MCWCQGRNALSHVDFVGNVFSELWYFSVWWVCSHCHKCKLFYESCLFFVTLFQPVISFTSLLHFISLPSCSLCICHSGWSLPRSFVQDVECNFVNCWLVLELFCFYLLSKQFPFNLLISRWWPSLSLLMVEVCHPLHNKKIVREFPTAHKLWSMVKCSIVGETWGEGAKEWMDQSI